MAGLTPHEITLLFLSLGVMLGLARILGEVAQWLHQPSVLGEILAGVLLGPTVLGALAPGWNAALFPTSGPQAVALDGMVTLSIVLFLLVAGIEVDLSTIWRQGRVALCVAVAGAVVPFVVGFAAGWLVPASMGGEPNANRLVFALFLATALAISALPVIAKTLMDLGLYRTDLGMIVISAAIFNDLFGWTVFAVILGLLDNAPTHGHSIGWTIGMTLAFIAVMLTVGRALIHRILPYLQVYTHWPGGMLSFALTLAFLGAAFTEWIGIHAIFGSFIVGVAVGDSPHMRERTRVTIEQFVSFIFAPLFFANIGLRVNFATHFDLVLVLTILAIACFGKLLGCVLGARLGGLAPRNAWAVGFAMNARGAMEIILGLLALQAGVITHRLFVALVVMAIVTSMLSGPVIQWTLKHRRPRRLLGTLSNRLFVRHMRAATRRQAIRELAEAACALHGLDLAAVEGGAWAREETMPTGIGNGIALPHARLTGLAAPVVVVGFSEAGIDFDAPDGEAAHVMFLILSPAGDQASQLELSAEIARAFRDHAMLDQVLRVANFTEFLALLKSAGSDPR